jgi:hypothetical protein
MLERREYYQLIDFEEICAEFAGFEIRGDEVLLKLRYSRSIVLPVSSKIVRVLQKLRAGDEVGILLTDSERDPVRVRRL